MKDVEMRNTWRIKTLWHLGLCFCGSYFLYHDPPFQLLFWIGSFATCFASVLSLKSFHPCKTLHPRRLTWPKKIHLLCVRLLDHGFEIHLTCGWWEILNSKLYKIGRAPRGKFPSNCHVVQFFLAVQQVFFQGPRVVGRRHFSTPEIGWGKS